MGVIGRHHDLFERADLALAHDREGGEIYDDEESQRADHAGHEKPAPVEVFVVPRTLLEGDLYTSHALHSADLLRQINRVILRELGGYRVQVAKGDEGGIGVRAVNNSLNWRALTFAQQIGKSGVDDKRDDRIAAVNRVSDVISRLGNLDDVQSIAGREARD